MFAHVKFSADRNTVPHVDLTLLQITHFLHMLNLFCRKNTFGVMLNYFCWKNALFAHVDFFCWKNQPTTFGGILYYFCRNDAMFCTCWNFSAERTTSGPCWTRPQKECYFARKNVLLPAVMLNMLNQAFKNVPLSAVMLNMLTIFGHYETMPSP